MAACYAASCMCDKAYISVDVCMQELGLTHMLPRVIINAINVSPVPIRSAVQQRRAPPGTSARTGVCRLLTDIIVDVNLAAPLQYRFIRFCLVPIKEGME